MEIKAVKFREHGFYTQPFAFGGEGGEYDKKKASGKYVCSICGYVYDPAEHDGVAFEELPDDWKCPRCKRPKEKFNKA